MNENSLSNNPIILNDDVSPEYATKENMVSSHGITLNDAFSPENMIGEKW